MSDWVYEVGDYVPGLGTIIDRWMVNDVRYYLVETTGGRENMPASFVERS